ncbi:MAG: N-acetylglucosamine-6-phosphate deacetylase [Thermotogae bacterium]|nr:N-acetylglucosamine-6-phosphate deacetylase [Thermotogota bacterium]
MKRLLIGEVLTPYRMIHRGAILTKDSRISGVGEAKEFCNEDVDELLDFSGAYISPGFIDIHVHGGGGSDTMDGTIEALLTIARTHASGGTTGLYPTTLTAPVDSILDTLVIVRKAMDLQITQDSGARILGAHVEGPYFSAAQAGAQNPKHLKCPTVEEIEKILATGAVKRVSLAPEIPGAFEASKMLCRQGALVSIGHSNALFRDVVKAMEYGFSHVTHIYSGMSTMKRINSYRLAGVLEATLLLDELTTEMIADGHHLPPSLMKLVIKNKGVERVCGITDAISAAGLGPGEYELGGLKIIVENEVARDYEISPPGCVAKLANREAFAGSVALMIDVLRNLVELASVPLPDAVKMITSTPAKIMGINHERGRLAPGHLADITVFTKEFEVLLTMVEGTIVYRTH